MIRVDISTALFLYLLVSTVFVLLAWAFFDFGTKLRNFSSEEKYIWSCSICGLTYIDSRHEEISRCPRCHSYNERITKEQFYEQATNRKGGEIDDNADRPRGR